MKLRAIIGGKAASMLAAATVLLMGTLAPAATVHAAAINTTASPRVSFTFDDGYASALTQAAPTLAKYGLKATDYVITSCVGMTTVPNSCPADTDLSYMTWDQITQLQNTYGWEIGSHTVTHPLLSEKTAAQQEQEMTLSKSALASHGINAVSFATPYGDYSPTTIALAAKYYESHRGFWDAGNNGWPYDDKTLHVLQVQEGVTVAQVKAAIDQAVATNSWLILALHDIKVSPSTNPEDYQYSTAELDQIAAYVKSKQTAGQINPVLVRDGLVKSDVNLLANGTFDSGIASGWSTDAPAVFAADAANNGSYPSPAKSVKFTAGAANTHLFSPQVAIDPAATYMLKNYVNLTARTSGELGFYIDEYNAAGVWISGQYKKSMTSAFAQNVNFTYKASSASVAKARVQFILTGGSGIKGYLDNSQWFPLTTATPPPAPTNLIANGTFDAGITGGWSTNDPNAIKANNANNGSPANPVNSVAMIATTANRHLFSPQVAVTNGKTYSLASYVKVSALTSGEIGFYIDEYDAAGNWISGQYKTGVRSISAGDTSFQYTPSSATVAKASLQYILVGNSGITAYVDDIRWYQN